MRTQVLFRVYDFENPRSFESRLNATRTMGAIDLPLPEEELTLPVAEWLPLKRSTKPKLVEDS